MLQVKYIKKFRDNKNKIYGDLVDFIIKKKEELVSLW